MSLGVVTVRIISCNQCPCKSDNWQFNKPLNWANVQNSVMWKIQRIGYGSGMRVPVSVVTASSVPSPRRQPAIGDNS